MGALTGHLISGWKQPSAAAYFPSILMSLGVVALKDLEADRVLSVAPKVSDLMLSPLCRVPGDVLCNCYTLDCWSVYCQGYKPLGAVVNAVPLVEVQPSVCPAWSLLDCWTELSSIFWFEIDCIACLTTGLDSSQILISPFNSVRTFAEPWSEQWRSLIEFVFCIEWGSAISVEAATDR